ncbi:hypothetical protein HBH98_183380 [Parastagonospora nodorum]|nr:hypothetical protein HBH52_026170 [Parastagonospora nodorum]KAH4258956.1 hypothetical protein HBI03_139010 [Parastagonospora nodorum]KAH4276570.1 hypothetical protein HBI04_110390 [Parastagonospora nodorum]KAH4310096.1 hypothetical protein HBI01_026390 [Parastagonospora nodorum]KAH4315690.1 hypothetical protein HBI02_053870 [Parastagonospora nodorum]
MMTYLCERSCMPYCRRASYMSRVAQLTVPLKSISPNSQCVPAMCATILGKFQESLDTFQ